MPDSAPVVYSFDDVFAQSGGGPIDLRIAAPTDPDNDALTITLDAIPTYGLVEYFDGSDWITAVAGQTLTSAELVSLRYTPPASGEFGGESISYSVSDGTLTTQATTEISSQVTETASPTSLIFSAIDSPSELNPDLYTVDASGTPHAIPLNPTDGSSAGIDGGFFHFAGNLYFNASTPTTDLALFKMDSNGNISAVGDGLGGYFVNQIDENSHFTEFAGSLYFEGTTNADGDQLIKLNADGTSQTIILNPGGQESHAGENGGFTEFDGSLYFSAFTAVSGSNNPDLIKLDQNGSFTDISTRLDPSNGSAAGEDGGFFVYNNALYFNAYSDALGDTLFRLDAGSTTPVPVDPTGSILTHLPTTADTGSAFHIFDGDLYFNEFSGVLGSDTLFQMDTSGNLTPFTYNGDALQGAGALSGFTDFAGATFFAATTATDGTQLFALDSSGDIFEITDIPGGAFDGGIPGNAIVFDGALYFDAYDGLGGDGLFKLDASGQLTELDLGNGVGGTTLAGVEGGFQEANGSLYFSAYTADGYELVRLDADGTVTGYDLNAGAVSNSFVPDDGQDFGLTSANVMNGTNGNDIIVGSSGNDIIDGGPGDDVIESRGGNDILTGGDGADTFVLSAVGAGNVVTITDYDLTGVNYGLAGGDKIDLSALLDANFTANSNVSDFVRIVPSNGDLKLQVDTDGLGTGANWTDVAILPGADTPFFPDSVTVHFNGTDYVISEPDPYNVHTAALAGGGWAVTWTQTAYQDGLYAGPYPAVFARVYDSSDHQIGGTIQISDPTDNMPDDNSILTPLSNGNFAVTWEDCLDNIQTRVYDPSGAEVTAGPTVVDTPDTSRELSQVTALTGGGYVVLWQQADSDGDDTVYVRTYDNSGNAVSGETAVDIPVAGVGNDLVGGSFSPVPYGDVAQIVNLQDGFAVMWESPRDDGSGNIHQDVFVRVFHNDGTPMSGEIQVNGQDGAQQDTPTEIVALGGDNFAVQWESDDFAGDQAVYTRFFNSADYSASPPVQADANADPNVVAEPWHLAALNGGGYVAFWGQYDLSDSNSDVYVQVYDASGNIAAGSQAGGILVNAVTGVSNLPDQVVALQNGGFAVLYDSLRDDGTGTGSDEDVFVRTFAADGTATSNEVMVNPANAVDDAGLQLVALPDGSFAALWSQDVTTANGGYEAILLQQMNSDGTFVGSAIEIAQTPSDLTNAQEQSLIAEFRASLASNQDLIVAAINGDTTNLSDFIFNLAVNFQQTDHVPTVVSDAANVAEGDTVSATAGTGVLFNDSDADGDSLTVSAIAGLAGNVGASTAGAYGHLTLNADGSYSYVADNTAAIDAAGAGSRPVDSFIVTVSDGLGGKTSETLSFTIDRPAIADNDSFTTDQATAIGSGLSLFADNGSGADNDPDGDSFSVIAVAGGTVGTQFALPSGALLTVNSDGTFSYDPNHAFDSLHLAAPGSGAADTETSDSFTYTLTGGGTATVTVQIEGTNTASTIYEGSGGNDTITGDATLPDLFHLEQGGDDHAIGGAANDGFYFGAAFTAADTVDGGGGTNNQIGLYGDYSGGLTLGATTITNIQVIACQPGYSYNLTTVDANVAAGNTLTIWASQLASANTLTFNGSAELDGKFIVYGGAGNDTLIGGAGDDIFYGLGGADTLTGNGGADHFVYTKASESTGNANGTAYDTITDFNAAADRFDLPGTINGINTAITTGALTATSFDTTLAAAVNAGNLAAHHAVLFSPDSGDYTGHTFLIVDANGAAGYQAGLDYVFDVTGGSLAGLSTGDFI